MKTNSANSRQQSGAALVVALILLVTLSIMAVSSMSSASLDLIMAGNEQYRARAFNAAEAGIERAIAANVFNNESDPPATTAAVNSSDSTNNDSYTYTITRPFATLAGPPPALYSQNDTFSVFYFTIRSTGTSERGSVSVSTQELFDVAPSSGSVSCNAAAGSCAPSATL